MYPGADMASDYNPNITTFKLHLKHIESPQKRNSIDVTKFRKRYIKTKVKKTAL